MSDSTASGMTAVHFYNGETAHLPLAYGLGLAVGDYVQSKTAGVQRVERKTLDLSRLDLRLIVITCSPIAYPG